MQTESIKGKIKFLPNGGAIVISSNENEIFIGEKNLGLALPNDEVLIEQFSNSRRKDYRKFERPEGKVIRILKRNTNSLVGTFKHAKYFKYVIPDNPSFRNQIRIDKKTDVKNNHKVLIKINEWNDPYQSLTGEILKDLGEKSDKGVDIESMIIEAGLTEKFTNSILEEVNNISKSIPDSELSKRRDLRDDIIFTIDPDTARDFDDAISFKKHPNNGWLLGIHIADVSTYIKSGSSIDKEAFKRGNSIYLVDRVIMMLPTELTTKICSLTPNDDHLTHSVLIHLSDDAEIINYETFPAIINSKGRLTYNQVQKHINGETDHTIPNNITNVLNLLYPVIKVVRSNRLNSGSLELNTPDIDIKLDESGNISSISKRSESKDAYNLIEDCMLLANKVVAEKIADSNYPSLYRIHEEPDETQWNKMGVELHSHGINAFPQSRKEINQIFNNIKGSTNEYTIVLSILKNLKRAEYSSSLIEHFGLSFEKYTHFTSPIRRYADLTIHRILKSRRSLMAASLNRGVH